MSNQERTCYECKHMSLCFVRRQFQEAIEAGCRGMALSVNRGETPKIFTDIFTTIAECCLKFETEEGE